MEIVDEIGGIPYQVWESEMDPGFVYKKLPSGKPGLYIAKVFLL